MWLEAYQEMLRKVAGDYSNLKIIGTQLRAAHSADRISWGAVLYSVGEDKMYLAPTRENVESRPPSSGAPPTASWSRRPLATPPWSP